MSNHQPHVVESLEGRLFRAVTLGTDGMLRIDDPRAFGVPDTGEAQATIVEYARNSKLESSVYLVGPTGLAASTFGASGVRGVEVIGTGRPLFISYESTGYRSAFPVPTTVHAGDGPATLSFASGRATFFGGNGNATVTALGGRNVLLGGTGKNTITGGDGKDAIYSGPNGLATLRGGGGDDDIYSAGGGNHIYTGRGAHVTVFAGNGDTVLGGGGDDIVYVPAGAVVTTGGPGITTVQVPAIADTPHERRLVMTIRRAERSLKQLIASGKNT
jgi:hypothetical protein